MADYRDRVKELRRVRAGDLLPDPRNWRRHPSTQIAAVRRVFDRVGIADAVIARETPEGLRLVDGHLRSDLDPEQVLPVIIVDLDEAEAGVVLASLDPLAMMAVADEEALSELVKGLDDEDEHLLGLLRETEMLPPVDSIAWPDHDERTEKPLSEYTFICHAGRQHQELIAALTEATRAGITEDPVNENTRSSALMGDCQRMASAKDIIVRPGVEPDGALVTSSGDHYSGKALSKRYWLRLGAFPWRAQVIGVLTFGAPLDRRRANGILDGARWSSILELGRLAFRDDTPRNSESRSHLCRHPGDQTTISEVRSRTELRRRVCLR